MDIIELTQIAGKLDAENAILKAKNAALKAKTAVLKVEIERLKVENERLRKWKQMAICTYEVECCSKCEEFDDDEEYICHVCKGRFCGSCWDGFHSDFRLPGLSVAGTRSVTFGVCHECVSTETCASCGAPNPSVFCPSVRCGKVFCSDKCWEDKCK